MQCVGFTLGGILFGVELQMVQEIIHTSPVFPLPNAPDFIEGVVTLRTSIIPLINIHQRLNLEPGHTHAEQSKFLVLDICGTTSCICVDSVTGIHHVENCVLTATTASSPAGFKNQYVQKTCSVGDSQMKILACNKILDAEEQVQIETITTDTQGHYNG